MKSNEIFSGFRHFDLEIVLTTAAIELYLEEIEGRFLVLGNLGISQDSKLLKRAWFIKSISSEMSIVQIECKKGEMIKLKR